MKYLQTFGFKPDNAIFRDHSWYFRNALVRANYNEFYKGISATDEYLVRFFKNLLLGESNPLSNREMHISNIQSLTPKSQNDTLNCTLEEMAVLQYLQSNPEAKQEDIAKHIGKLVVYLRGWNIGSRSLQIVSTFSMISSHRFRGILI